MREAYCGTRDENEEHEDALFVVLVLPPLLALLLFAVVKKVRKVSSLVFAFVRILVVVAPLLLKEVIIIIIITERERDYSNSQVDGQQTKTRGVIPSLRASSFRLSRTIIPRTHARTHEHKLSFISLSLASVNDHEYDSLLSLKVFISDV